MHYTNPSPTHVNTRWSPDGHPHVPEAIARHTGSMAIIHDAVKEHPDREALYADPPRLYAAMDTPSLERLRHGIEALHARVDLLRKKPKPAKPAAKTQASRW